MPVFANKEQLAKYGVTKREARKLELALCALADFEGSVKKALSARGHSDHVLHDMCDALRLIVDGE